jgi:hypothetical protein
MMMCAQEPVIFGSQGKRLRNGERSGRNTAKKAQHLSSLSENNDMVQTNTPSIRHWRILPWAWHCPHPDIGGLSPSCVTGGTFLGSGPQGGGWWVLLGITIAIGTSATLAIALATHIPKCGMTPEVSTYSGVYRGIGAPLAQGNALGNDHAHQKISAQVARCNTPQRKACFP